MSTPNPPSRLPKDFPHRAADVRGWGTLQVPRYVVRIDIDNGGAGTHGWQVRYNGKTVFFSDSQAKKPGSPRSSLRRAVAYLGQIYAGPPVRRPTSELQGKALKTGFRGVRLHYSKKSSRNFREIYMEVSSIVNGLSAQRIYVGTENTASQDRLDAAFKKALSMRRSLELAHWGHSTIRVTDIRRARWDGTPVS